MRRRPIEALEPMLKRLKKGGYNFTTAKTSYTTKLIVNGEKYLFSKNPDASIKGLGLVTMVRNDAKNYIKNRGKSISETAAPVNWYKINEEEISYKKQEVIKIDLNAAYWTKAIAMGVISNKTIDKFESIKFDSVKEKKSARLRALGALATIKKVEFYDKGVRVDQRIEYDELTRDLYIDICRMVGKDMVDIMKSTGTVYYYWDCLFIFSNKFDPDLVDIAISEKGYDYTLEYDEALIVKERDIDFIKTIQGGVRYPIKFEDK